MSWVLKLFKIHQAPKGIFGSIRLPALDQLNGPAMARKCRAEFDHEIRLSFQFKFLRHSLLLD